MLIEQVIEFELREHGLPGCRCTLTGYFHDKTKMSKENLREAANLILSFTWAE